MHLNFGCGAHSETGQEEADREIPRGNGVIVDELDVEYQQAAPADAAGESAVGGAGTEHASAEETPAAETRAEETPVEETPAAAAAVHDDITLVTPAEELSESGAAPADDNSATGQLSFESLIAEVPEADSPED